MDILFDECFVSFKLSSLKESPNFRSARVGSRIPRIIWKLGPVAYSSLSHDTHLYFEKLISENPTYELRYMDNEQCATFLKSKLADRAHWCFQMLLPGAYKADFVRYCLLYYYGGVYSDLKQVFLKKLDEVVNHPELVLTKDLLGNQIQISFMASRPRHLVFKNAYEAVIKKVEERDYGQDFLHLTGPHLFGDVFHAMAWPPNSYTMDYKQQLQLMLY